MEFLITSKDITGCGASSTLLIFNNERGFSATNIESICRVGKSTKKGNRHRGYIGEKGKYSLFFFSFIVFPSSPLKKNLFIHGKRKLGPIWGIFRQMIAVKDQKIFWMTGTMLSTPYDATPSWECIPWNRENHLKNCIKKFSINLALGSFILLAICRKVVIHSRSWIIHTKLLRSMCIRTRMSSHLNFWEMSYISIYYGRAKVWILWELLWIFHDSTNEMFSTE